MRIIQVRLDNDKYEGRFCKYFNYEFGVLNCTEFDDNDRVDFGGARKYFKVDTTEYKLITGVSE